MSRQRPQQEPSSVFGLKSHQLSRILSLGLEDSGQVESVPPTLSVQQLMEQPGARIGRYRLVEVVGEGGMAVVYAAEQAEPIRRKVALKIVKVGMDTRQVIARFEAERQALALMDHPHIAKVLDAGATETGRPYFVMELVEGVSITTYCNEHRLTIPGRLALFRYLCLAVQYAHEQGIIHRDIKPTNVLVTQRDGRPYPKVIDFGIAKAVNQRLTEKTLVTCYEQIIGTPMYMSPEQALCEDTEIDARADIYSLGVLLYELLAGKTPFDLPTRHQTGYLEIQRIIRETEPSAPSLRVNTLGDERTEIAQQRQTTGELLSRAMRGDLDWIVMKALEKERAHRYETARALAEDIQRHMDNLPVLARPPGVGYRLAKLTARHQQHIVLALAILLALSSILFAAIMIHRAKVLVLRDIASGGGDLQAHFLATAGTGERGKDVRISGTATSVPPIAWWRFDETAGSTAYDSAGTNHATVQGATWTTGYIGGALQFDGIDDAVRTPLRIDQVERSAGATFCAWVYPEAKEPNEYCARWGDRHVISTDDGGKDWSILCKYEDLWRVFVGQDVRYTGLPVDVNQWQFVAAVFEPGSGVRFYKNHQKVFLPEIGYGTSGNITIGDTTSPSVPSFFAGRIDEVQIYNRPLNDQDIAELTGIGSDRGIEEVRLPVSWWCYQTRILQDLINGHRGTMADAPHWAPGPFKAALVFDGISEYLDCGNVSAYNRAGPITVCAWIKVHAADKNVRAVVNKGASAWSLQSAGGTIAFHCTLQSGALLALEGRLRVDDGTWHHVAGVFDESEAGLYVDGVLDRTQRLAGTIAINDHAMWIGANSERPGQNWNGAIGDVRLYDCALSSQEIAALARKIRVKPS